MVVLGGLGSITGSVTVCHRPYDPSRIIKSLQRYRMIIYPILLIAMMIYRPEGLLAGKELSISTITKGFQGVKSYVIK